MVPGKGAMVTKGRRSSGALARRVGAAISRHLHAGGANLLVHYRSSAVEARALQAELNPRSQQPGAALVVDLTDVGFIDSTGLGVLVTTLKHVREAGGTLDVVVTSRRVLKVFALTGLDVVIPLHSTLDEALASS